MKDRHPYNNPEHVSAHNSEKMKPHNKTTSRAVLACLVVLCLILGVAWGMDKSKFENCDQKGFCKRLRGSANTSNYHVIGGRLKDGAFHASMFSNNGTFELLDITIEAYEHGIFRMRIQEKTEGDVQLKNRHEVKDVIVNSAKKIPINPDISLAFDSPEGGFLINGMSSCLLFY